MSNSSSSSSSSSSPSIVESHTVSITKTADANHGSSSEQGVNSFVADIVINVDPSIDLDTKIDDGDDSQVIDLSVITKTVQLFNKYNKNLIKKYDYKFADDTCELIMLFNHVMKKQGLTQKYAYYDIVFHKDQNKIVFNRKVDKTNPFFKIKPDVEFIPIKNLIVFYKIKNNQIIFKIYYTSVLDEGGSTAAANSTDIFEEFINDIIETSFANINKHLSRDESGRLSFVDLE